MRPPFLLIPDKILQKNQITEPGSLADLLPALTQFTIEYGSSAALFGGQGGNITRQATSLLLRASEVVTDFFMCITQPIAHLCGVWSAVLFYIEHKDAH